MPLKPKGPAVETAIAASLLALMTVVLAVLSVIGHRTSISVSRLQANMPPQRECEICGKTQIERTN